MSSLLKIGVLVSGRGSNLQSILDAITSKKIKATVAIVISNNDKAYALERAKKAGVPIEILLSTKGELRESYDKKIVATLKKHNVELVVLAGFMRILSPVLLAAFKNRIINIHPSLLPRFPGLHPQKQALEAGVKESGCTVHFVDEGCDTGPIILQAKVPIEPGDTVETLEERILKEEHKLLVKVIDLIAQNKVKILDKQGMQINIEEDSI